MKWMLILALTGCTNGAKHETLALQCFGFCALTDIRHEVNKSEATPVETPRQ